MHQIFHKAWSSKLLRFLQNQTCFMGLIFKNFNIMNYAQIAKNKSLLKEYTVNNMRTVYLKDGDEFQIQLFNPETEEIAAEISIEGSNLSNKIVLRPGERI